MVDRGKGKRGECSHDEMVPGVWKEGMASSFLLIVLGDPTNVSV